MAAIIAVTGRKGGIGKSSITANLAVELAALKRTVTVLDADPQQSLIEWSRMGQGFLAACVQPIETGNAEKFRRLVEKATGTAERVLIDTPPGFAEPALFAALLADLVLIPCGPSPLDILAAKQAAEVAVQAQRERGGDRPRIRFVPNKITVTNMGRQLTAALEAIGQKVLPAITQRVVIAESALHGLTVREYAASSPATAEFTELAKAVEKAIR